MNAAAAGLALMALAAPAAAQTPVATLPARDVTIVYRVGGAAHAAVPGGLPDTVRVAWSAQLQRLRVEPQGRSQTLLVDLAAPSVRVVDAGLRSAMALPVRARDLDPIRLQDARLSPRGRAAVAGLNCTEYAVEARRGNGTVCLTGDGVALRAVGQVDGKDGSFTAVAVTYGSPPASAFEVPPDYMQLALPRGLNLPPGLQLPPGLGRPP